MISQSHIDRLPQKPGLERDRIPPEEELQRVYAVLGALPGIVLLGLGVLANQWVLKWALAPRDYVVPRTLAVSIAVAQALLLLAGIALLRGRRQCGNLCRRWASTPLGERAIAWAQCFVPPMDRWIALCLFPILAVDGIFLFVVQARERFPVLHPLPWVYLADKIAFDAGLYLTCIAVALYWARSWIAAMAIAYFYVAMCIADIVIYYFGFTLFEKQYLAFATPYSLAAFLSGRVILLAAAVVTIGLLVLPIYWIKDRFTRYDVGRSIAFTAAVGLLNLPGVFYHLSSVAIVWDLQQEVYTRLNQQLPYLAQNSLVNLITEVAYRPSEPSEALTLGDSRDVIDHFRLPLVGRRYPRLGLKPFRRVIVIPTESLSLDLLGGHNPNLPEEVSPFYASDAIRSEMFNNYRTSAVPTLPGLSVLFSSHPNAGLSVSRKYPQSFVRELLDAGYETIFLRSVSKFFANENRHFHNAGFQKIIGSEEFEASSEYRPYVREWGACDRIVYQELARLLEERQERRVFVMVLGVDTHPPAGRRDYSGLAYPQLPEYVARQSNEDRRGLLRAVFFHDYDIRFFIEELKRRGLWDDGTMIVLTADHSAPLSGVVSGIAGYPEEQLSRIPLVFLTPQPLPPHDRDVPGSQLDFAPTLLHLLDLPVPTGYWGESLFYREKSSPFVGVFRNTIYVEGHGFDLRIPLAQPQDKMEDRLISLYRGFVE